MTDGTTPNLGLVKPEVGASKDTWGQKTNDNWDKVDAGTAVLGAANIFSEDQTVRKPTGDASLLIKSIAGFTRALRIYTGNIERWAFGANSVAETGGNSGSSLILLRYADDGALLATAMSINRATGKTTLESLDVTGAISSGADIVLATANTSGYITRPNVDGKKSIILAVAGGGPLDEIILNATDIKGIANPADTDNDTTLATTAFVKRIQGISEVPYVDQASYTFTLDMMGKTLRCGGQVTSLVIPPVASVAWPIGARLDIMTQGTAIVTVSGGAGVTVTCKSTSQLKLEGAWSVATAQCIDNINNQWVLFGDLVPA